jgi:Clp amino terminal domain, pathogenicity island component
MGPEIHGLVHLVEKRAASASALDRLRAAVGVVDERRAQDEAVLDHFVARARRSACSWTEIGTALGVSKQAAHQRFPDAGGDVGTWPPHASDTVRAAFASAQDEARAMGHNYLGTEHVLLGLLAESDGLAAHALSALGVERNATLHRIGEVIGIGSPRAWQSLGVTPRTKKALELARAQGKALGHRCIGTEHMLLGLVNLEEDVAVQLLNELGASPQAVRRQLADMLGVDVERLSRARRRRVLRSR